jgi:L-lactate dehydrogenase (cytochrome)/(S)-mandelate dehydrogenase
MRAAAAAGTAYCLSHGSVCSLEQLAEAAGSANRWMQVFIYRDRGFTRELAQRAAASNYDALVLTVDNQLMGNRERDIRNGFIIPPRLGITELAAMAYKWRWLLRMRNELPRLTMGNYVKPGDTAGIAEIAGKLGSRLDPGMSWKDVDELRSIWRGPLVLKGILSPLEAREAVARGVDGIIVSNHGGRQLDGAVASLDALPAIVDAVGGRIPVLMDGGVRRGSDVVKAIALGAAACLIARPQLWGLAMAGETGVAHVLEILRREIDRTMGLCGFCRLEDITPSLLFRRTSSQELR